MIGTGVKRGTAELAILSILEDGPLHGYELARRIERQTKGALSFSLAALYPMLYRMNSAAGFVARGKPARMAAAVVAIGSLRRERRSRSRFAQYGLSCTRPYAAWRKLHMHDWMQIVRERLVNPAR